MTPQAERIASLDTLRGLGVLGILAVNAAVVALPYAAQVNPAAIGPVDPGSAGVWWTTHVLFERKFLTLFSMLFGASILLVGGEGEETGKNRVLWRRLGWLAVIGAAHGAVVWYGDILLCYALAGMVASLFRGWPARRLLITGAVLFAVTGAQELADFWTRGDAAAVIPFASLEAARQEIGDFSSSFAASMRANFDHWLIMTGAILSFIPATVALMLVGMGLQKSGVLTGRRSAVLYFALLAGGVISMALLAGAATREVAGGFASFADRAWRESINALLSPLMTLGYVGLVCLWLKTPLRGLARPLAATGQMAFTNYLTQSLLMTGIFWGGRGLGLFGVLTLAQIAPIVVGIWLVQLVWSPLWLAAFRYGPFEWAWRSLTFGRFVPFRRVAGEA
jgi:uncharacterized protein